MPSTSNAEFTDRWTNAPRSPTVAAGLGVVVFYAIINVFQALFLVGWSALWMSLAIMASLVSEELPLVMARRCWAPPVLFFAGARLEIEGIDRLDLDAPYVFVMNHQSMIDVPVAIAAIPQNIRFVAKRSLLRVPFLGGYIRRTKYIAIDRSRRLEAYQKIREAAHVVSEGRSFLVYPEGTRSNDGVIKKFKRGPFVLAQAATVPVVPVVIEGAGNVLPTGTFRIRPGRIRVHFGEPIPTDSYGSESASIDDLRDDVHTAMSQLYESVRADQCSIHVTPA